MQTLSLLIGPEFGFNRENQIVILRDVDANNAFQLESDGIYLDASLIASGNGFVDQGGSFLRIGYKSPFGWTTDPGRITANNTVHRFYTEDSEGNITDLRTNIDVLLPGDIVREPASDNKFKYKLVRNVTTDPYVVTYVTLGTW